MSELILLILKTHVVEFVLKDYNKPNIITDNFHVFSFENSTAF